MIYELPGASDPVTQGDVLDDCPLLVWQVDESGERPTPNETEARVVVLTQACDMAQGKANQVLVAVIHAAHFLVDKGVIAAKSIRDQVRLHRVYGWYFLPAASAMEESIVDLRSLHAVPRVILDRLAQDGKRVCRITTPYREHLAQHFSTTYSRIGLPEPYPTEPD